MGHYVYNVFLMVCLITLLMPVICWAIPPTNIGDRAEADLALVLTGQAFKLNIAEKLPKVSYITMVDIYVLACFLMMFMGICMHAWIGSHVGWKVRDLDLFTQA